MENRKWIVYMIIASTGKIYTGITLNLARRFSEHQQKQKGAKFFNFARAEKIVFYEYLASRSEASKRECMIKRLKRQEKLELIESFEKSNKKSAMPQ